MKIITALIVTTTAALWVTGCGQSKESDSNADANTHEKELAKLRTQLARAKAEANRTPRVEVVQAVEAPVKLEAVTDAKGLIAKLAENSTTGADVKSQRRVIHYFESLVDGNNDSVTAIAAYLKTDANRQFGRQSMRQQLNVTTAQMEEMRAFGEKQREEIGTKIREIWGNQELSREERGEKMRELIQGSTEKIKEMLTDEQRIQLDGMGDDAGRNLRSLLGGGNRWGGGDRRSRGGSDRGRGPGGR